VTLLQQRDAARQEARVRLWNDTRKALRAALHELLPGSRVYLYGSLCRSGIFNGVSDIDIALTAEPLGKTIWLLQAELEERLGRPIDLALLGETRLRDKIMREGEEWMT
jgi:predicted nucleotidyltransferase